MNLDSQLKGIKTCKQNISHILLVRMPHALTMLHKEDVTDSIYSNIAVISINHIFVKSLLPILDRDNTNELWQFQSYLMDAFGVKEVEKRTYICTENIGQKLQEFA